MKRIEIGTSIEEFPWTQTVIIWLMRGSIELERVFMKNQENKFVCEHSCGPSESWGQTGGRLGGCVSHALGSRWIPRAFYPTGSGINGGKDSSRSRVTSCFSVKQFLKKKFFFFLLTWIFVFLVYAVKKIFKCRLRLAPLLDWMRCTGMVICVWLGAE